MATTRTKTVVGRAAVGITVVGLAAVGLLGYRASVGEGSSTGRYRTVTAAAGTVNQVLSLSGTVHHVSQASVSFPTNGKVVSVNVRAGDTVTAGQALASIDTTPLQNLVLAADATYKSAVAQYETDQSTYASSSSTTTAAKKASTAATTARATRTTTSTGFPSGGGAGKPGGGVNSGGDATAGDVTAAEDALSKLKVGIGIVNANLTDFSAKCGPLIPTTPAAPASGPATVTPAAVTPAAATIKAAAATASGTPASSGSGTTSGSVSASSKAVPGATVTVTATVTATVTVSALSTGCQGAINTLTASLGKLTGLMDVATAAMEKALKALKVEAAALSAQASAIASATAGATIPSSALQNQASVLTSTNSALQAAAAAAVGNAASRTGSGNVTEATLITDKANIEATRISLAEAQDQLSRATITSPIAGKVASIPFILGQQANATASAVIIGSGSIEVTVPVPLAKRPQVATNQTATVTSSVGGTTITGTISRISLLPTSTGISLAAVTAGAATGAAAATSSTASTTYATVITVPSGGDLLPEGSRVQATITTKTVDAKVVLPASAVTPTGTTSATVQVLNGSTVTVKRVVTGAVGDAYVEIVSGINVGEKVVIADTTIPIAPASIQTGRPSQTAAQQTVAGDPPQGGGVPPAGDAAPTR